MVFFTKLGLMEFQVRYFGLIFFFLSNRQLRVVLDGKSSQEYPVNAGVLQGSILVLHFSYYTLMLMTFLMMLSAILLSMLMILPSTLSVIKASHLWQQLELASEVESELRDTVDWGGKWVVDLNAGKIELVSFD